MYCSEFRVRGSKTVGIVVHPKRFAFTTDSEDMIIILYQPFYSKTNKVKRIKRKIMRCIGKGDIRIDTGYFLERHKPRFLTFDNSFTPLDESLVMKNSTRITRISYFAEFFQRMRRKKYV